MLRRRAFAGGFSSLSRRNRAVGNLLSLFVYPVEGVGIAETAQTLDRFFSSDRSSPRVRSSSISPGLGPAPFRIQSLRQFPLDLHTGVARTALTAGVFRLRLDRDTPALEGATLRHSKRARRFPNRPFFEPFSVGLPTRQLVRPSAVAATVDAWKTIDPEELVLSQKLMRNQVRSAMDRIDTAKSLKITELGVVF